MHGTLTPERELDVWFLVAPIACNSTAVRLRSHRLPKPSFEPPGANPQEPSTTPFAWTVSDIAMRVVHGDIPRGAYQREWTGIFFFFSEFDSREGEYTRLFPGETGRGDVDG
jgi:hypothetical protein